MAVAYDPTVYNGLPTLATVGDVFKDKNGDDLVSNYFRNLFIQYKMEHIFGLVLLHRHFDMTSQERLVEYCGTSVPWDATNSGFSARVKPSNWALAQDGSFRPYEFYYSTNDEADTESSPDDPQYSAFIESFGKVLYEKGLANVFGLTRYLGDDFKGSVEMTEGRANISLHPSHAPTDIVARTATWFFSPILWGKKCFCVCREDKNKKHEGKHAGHVAKR